MKSSLAGYTLTLALGFAIAWIAKPTPEARPSVATDPARVPPPARPERPRPPKVDPKIKSLLDEISAVPERDYKKLSELKKKITTAQLPDLVKTLAKRAGIAGLSNADQRTFNDLIVRWYQADPAEALGWIDTLESTNDRQKFLVSFLGKEAEKDPAKALAMVDQYGIRFDNEPVPYNLRNAIMKMPLDEMMAALSQLRTGKDGNSWSTEFHFPKGFDIASFSKRLLDLQASMPEGEQLAYVPSFLGEWTAQDPQAVWAFILELRNLEKLDGNQRDLFKRRPYYNQFFAAYKKSAAPEEFGRMVAQIPENLDSFEVYGALAKFPSPETVESFIQASPGTRDETLKNLISLGMQSSGDSYDQLEDIVISTMSPEERLRLIPDLTTQNSPRHRALLEKLGHPPAEIDAMVPAKK